MRSAVNHVSGAVRPGVIGEGVYRYIRQRSTSLPAAQALRKPEAGHIPVFLVGEPLGFGIDAVCCCDVSAGGDPPMRQAVMPSQMRRRSAASSPGCADSLKENTHPISYRQLARRRHDLSDRSSVPQITRVSSPDLRRTGVSAIRGASNQRTTCAVIMPRASDGVVDR